MTDSQSGLFVAIATAEHYAVAPSVVLNCAKELQHYFKWKKIYFFFAPPL